MNYNERAEYAGRVNSLKEMLKQFDPTSEEYKELFRAYFKSRVTPPDHDIADSIIDIDRLIFRLRYSTTNNEQIK